MKLLTLELLNANTDVVGWLERQLASEDLTSVVAELLGWQVASKEPASLEEVLGDRLPRILESGLAESDAQSLLHSPRVLIELQEQICFRGGPHWQSLGVQGESGRSSGTGETIPPNLDRVLKFLDRQSPTLLKTSASTAQTVKNELPQRRPGLTAWPVQLLALSALIGFGVYLFNQQFAMNPPGRIVNMASNDWGLNNLQKFQGISSGPEYLNAVATAMNDWLEKPPTDSASGTQRIQELIQGCQNLIADDQMNHSPLDDESRKWLHAKCSAWIEKFRDELVAVNQNPESWPEVFNRMNAKLDKAVSVIREQADKVSMSAAA